MDGRPLVFNAHWWIMSDLSWSELRIDIFFGGHHLLSWFWAYSVSPNRITPN
jgi:hypothetical protein